MKNTLNCPVVRDLLPLYAEKLTSEESNAAIRQHLDECENCRKDLERIQQPIDCPTMPNTEIDYMRKAKRSLKGRSYILAGVIAASCLALLSIFLRLFIIGTPVFIEEAAINYQWNYDADKAVYSIHGSLQQTNTSARINVYEDKENNQIKVKLYEVIPSVFFNSNQLSANISWNGEKDIVWQGKDRQQIIASSQYLPLSITQFKEGHYTNIIDAFDMKGAARIQQLYDHAAEVSSKQLAAFDEASHSQYLIISIPPTSGTYSVWIKADDALPKQELDDRIFLYQEDGQYYFYQQGQPLKKLSPENLRGLLDYIDKKKP
ncbi:hypothetical protein Ami103574_13895 [Aminipila butyrica]|uniref:Putative zinc-finger domain-containing protein n=1 Tax=Aminipila butyrica TaxID=433296 RepID=A0A858C1D3_9FIRM|nr:zf-HC2 domain-containing protein [Aminipila butyrica]QIB70316.1 hypothetical protein Ami103574_13895 [Aminipila butyrica]